MNITKKISFAILIILVTNVYALRLNLKNTDINTFINTVAMSTGKNFIVDPRVRGVVNIIGNQEIDDAELYNLFLTILKVYGYVAIEGEYVTRIVPQNLSKNSAYVSKDATDAIVTTTISLDNVIAKQIIPIVRPIMSPHGVLNFYEPTNSLIIIDTSANIKRLRGLLVDLDKPTGKDFDFIKIKYSTATNISTIIKTIMGKNAPIMTVDQNNNQIIIAGRESQKLRARLIVAELDKKTSRSSSTEIFYLKNAVAKDVLPILQNISQHTKTVEDKEGKKTVQSNIQADETTNSIIVTGDNEIKQIVKDIIEKLDVRRAQVLIEAIIAEVSSSDSEELGAQLIANTSNAVGISNLSGIINSLISAGNSAEIASALSSKGLNFVVGDYDDSDNQGFGIIINALKGVGSANILSTPSILTLDNEEAEIIVGQEVPFITNSRITSDGNPFQNFERKDVGLKLSVKPQIDNGNSVKLDIFQEISNVLPSSSASDLITSKRSLKTSVIVEDGKMLILGGLIDDTWRDTKTKIPLLGDIPAVGRLFSYDTQNKEKRNLLVFIRPTILKDQVLAEQISMEKYQVLRAKQLINNEDFDIDEILTGR